VIKVILGYSGLPESRDDRPSVIAASINETLQEFVLNTLKAKRGDFEQIFNELKAQYNSSKASVSSPYSFILSFAGEDEGVDNPVVFEAVHGLPSGVDRQANGRL